MRKISKILTIGAVTFALCLSVNNFASAKDSASFNVAVVDLQKIVVSSPQINALKVEEKKKMDDLVAFVEKANADLANEKNDVKKKAIEEGYNKELNIKKADIDKEYIKKMSEIDKNISDIINAKSVNYDLVLTKTSVIKGGVDITNEVIKALK